MEDNQDGQILHIKSAIEALLFVYERPITVDQIKRALETVETSEIKSALKLLQEEYQTQERGIVIREIAEGWQMLSDSLYAPYLRNFFRSKHKEKLSKPALEALAIIAYKQPVTRADIENIRGVNSDGVATHLLEKELIKVVGRKDVAGRPFVYGTTKLFLEYFGLKSLDVLPRLEEFINLEEHDANASKPSTQQAILPLDEQEQEEILSEEESIAPLDNAVVTKAEEFISAEEDDSTTDVSEEIGQNDQSLAETEEVFEKGVQNESK